MIAQSIEVILALTDVTVKRYATGFGAILVEIEFFSEVSDEI